jgi:PAS domain-containing protein
VKQTYDEQVKILYDNVPTGIVVSIVNSLIVTFALWHHGPRPLILSWTAANVLVGLGSAFLVRSYRKARAPDSHRQRWALRITVASFLAGAAWGALGLLVPPYTTLPYQVFVTFVLGGMATGAIALGASFFPAYVAFLLPTLLPLDLWFFVQGGRTYGAMGALLGVFILALYTMGRNVHRSVAQSVRLSIEKTELADALRAEHEQLEQTNRTLAKEILERQRVAQELRSRETLYRGMFEKNPAVQLLLDPESGAIVDANRAASAYYGYGLDDLKRKNLMCNSMRLIH